MATVTEHVLMPSTASSPGSRGIHVKEG